MSKLAIFAAAIVVATATAASAHGIDSRQAEHAAAIEDGRRSGEITWIEGVRLRAEQKRIAGLEADLKADGYLSKRDRLILRGELDAAEEHIDAESNDRWHRIRILPRVGR